MKKFSSIIAAMAMLTSTVAVAAETTATVSDFSGKVLVNRGQGFVPLSGKMALSTGDKLMVGENSFAVLSYAECAVSLSSPAIVTVAQKAPCVDGASADAVVVQPVADLDMAPAPYFPLPLILLGVGAVAVGVVVVTGVLDDNNNIGISGP